MERIQRKVALVNSWLVVSLSCFSAIRVTVMGNGTIAGVRDRPPDTRTSDTRTSAWAASLWFETNRTSRRRASRSSRPHEKGKIVDGAEGPVGIGNEGVWVALGVGGLKKNLKKSVDRCREVGLKWRQHMQSRSNSLGRAAEAVPTHKITIEIVVIQKGGGIRPCEALATGGKPRQVLIPARQRTGKMRRD